MSANIRVLQSFRSGRSTTNPYLSQLVLSLPPEVTALGFSWKSALFGKYDVFHVHWPEVLLRASTGPRTWIRRILFFAVIARLTITRRAVVRTLHNVSAHEGGSRVETWLSDLCDDRTTLWVRLNPETQPPTSAAVTTILHGHARDWFSDYPKSSTAPGRILYFGLVRKYKGVEQLIDAFEKIEDPLLSLHIVGKPQSAELAHSLSKRTLGDTRISTRFEYVDDETLARELGECQVAILPYRNMHNSGAVILALSLNRAVLVPSNSVTEALADEVGVGWVQTFTGDLMPSTIQSALARAATLTGEPDLSSRDWIPIGLAHQSAYKDAIRLATHPRRESLNA